MYCIVNPFKSQQQEEDDADFFSLDGKSTTRGNKLELGLDGSDAMASQHAERTLTGAEQRELRRQHRTVRALELGDMA